MKASNEILRALTNLCFAVREAERAMYADASPENDMELLAVEAYEEVVVTIEKWATQLTTPE